MRLVPMNGAHTRKRWFAGWSRGGDLVTMRSKPGSGQRQSNKANRAALSGSIESSVGAIAIARRQPQDRHQFHRSSLSLPGLPERSCRNAGLLSCARGLP